MKSSSDGEPLAGSPYSLAVVPGDLSPSHCSARLMHGGHGLTAGGEASVCVQAKDRYGNEVAHRPLSLLLPKGQVRRLQVQLSVKKWLIDDADRQYCLWDFAMLQHRHA